MVNKRNILIIIFATLAVSSAYFAVKYSIVKSELKEVKSQVEVQTTDTKMLNFMRLFIKDVLKADQEVSFETRLQLENAVRDLEDQEVLAQWQRFTEASTEAQAQTEAKNLLEMLADKIR